MLLRKGKGKGALFTDRAPIAVVGSHRRSEFPRSGTIDPVGCESPWKARQYQRQGTKKRNGMWGGRSGKWIMHAFAKGQFHRWLSDLCSWKGGQTMICTVPCSRLLCHVKTSYTCCNTDLRTRHRIPCSLKSVTLAALQT